MISWLNTNAFFTPTSALPVISDYARNNWVFVAAKINRTATEQTRSQPHPLAFTFASGRPVYPLRLTGVENQSCAIDLFVFGPKRAEVAGFKAQYCGQPQFKRYDPEDSYSSEHFIAPSAGAYRIANPEHQRLIPRATVVTKLTGILKSTDMQSDGWVNWEAFEPELPTLYSDEGARNMALVWFFGIGMLGMAIFSMIRSYRKLPSWILLFLWLMAAILGAIRYSAVHKTAVERYFPFAARNRFGAFTAALEEFASDRTTVAGGNPAINRVTFEEFQEAMKKRNVANVFTAQPIKSEATPGNIILRETLKGVQVIWHDIDGVPCLIQEFPDHPHPEAHR